MRRCQNHGAHSALKPSFICTSCLDFTDRLLKAACPGLFDDSLWLPTCRLCSDGLRAHNRDGLKWCVCPLGRPSEYWTYNGKLFCSSCRMATVQEREFRWGQAWAARSEGRREIVDVDGEMREMYVRDRCMCGHRLDGGAMRTCPQCSGLDWERA